MAVALPIARRKDSHTSDKRDHMTAHGSPGTRTSAPVAAASRPPGSAASPTTGPRPGGGWLQSTHIFSDGGIFSRRYGSGVAVLNMRWYLYGCTHPGKNSIYRDGIA